jgi:protein-L-isoaspartate(D-aspartate) O-methyltransferase
MDYKQQAEQLIFELRLAGIRNPKVLSAIENMPRHLFVESRLEPFSYANQALPIECQQTISQPYIVARMTELLLEQGPIENVLEIGTGSGYQAAVLSQLIPQVYSVERIKKLLTTAKQRFKKLNLDNIHTLYGDGNLGWPAHSPYQGIIVTAAAEEVPPALLEQLAEGASLIIPLGKERSTQQLTRITRQENQFYTEILDSVIFVPLLSGKI